MLNNKLKVLSAIFFVTSIITISSCALQQTDKNDQLISGKSEALNDEALDIALQNLELSQEGIARTPTNEANAETTTDIAADSLTGVAKLTLASVYSCVG